MTTSDAPSHDTIAATPTTVDVELGDRVVTVPRGGLFDRYRMNTDLDEMARDPRVTGVDFFRHLPKTRVESSIGPTMTPNFYYRISTARLVMTAPSKAIRARLPRELRPLEIAPGRGLVSVMFFRYDVCDIDFYTEAAVATVVRPARHKGPSIIDLTTGLADNHLHSHVLALPVSTDIAQVRGHDGYGFPKWVTEIDVDIDDRRTTARVLNDAGTTDLALSAPTPRQTTHQTGERVSTLTSYTSMDTAEPMTTAWLSTLSQTNVLASGAKVFPRGLNLQIGEGRMSDDLRSLDPGRVVHFEVVTNGQLALHMPVPVSVPGVGDTH